MGEKVVTLVFTNYFSFHGILVKKKVEKKIIKFEKGVVRVRQAVMMRENMNNLFQRFRGIKVKYWTGSTCSSLMV